MADLFFFFSANIDFVVQLLLQRFFKNICGLTSQNLEELHTLCPGFRVKMSLQ